MIKVERKKRGYSSCTACDRGELTENGKGLKYPYDTVTEITMGASSNMTQCVRLCDQCVQELVEAMTKEFDT